MDKDPITIIDSFVNKCSILVYFAKVIIKNFNFIKTNFNISVIIKMKNKQGGE